MDRMHLGVYYESQTLSDAIGKMFELVESEL